MTYRADDGRREDEFSVKIYHVKHHIIISITHTHGSGRWRQSRDWQKLTRILDVRWLPTLLRKAQHTFRQISVAFSNNLLAKLIVFSWIITRSWAMTVSRPVMCLNRMHSTLLLADVILKFTTINSLPQKQIQRSCRSFDSHVTQDAGGRWHYVDNYIGIHLWCRVWRFHWHVVHTFHDAFKP